MTYTQMGWPLSKDIRTFKKGQMVAVNYRGQVVRLEAPEDGYLVTDHLATPVLCSELALAVPLEYREPLKPGPESEIPEVPMGAMMGYYCCGCDGIKYNRDEYRRWLTRLESFRIEVGIEAVEGTGYRRGVDGEPRPLDWPMHWVANRCESCGQLLRVAGVE